MKQSFSNFKLKITANLETFKARHSSPDRRPRTSFTSKPNAKHSSNSAAMLSELSRSASLNYTTSAENNNIAIDKINISLSATSPVSKPTNSQKSPLPDEFAEISISGPLCHSRRVLSEHGYECTSKIATTLQGEIFKAKVLKNKKKAAVVIKVTDKMLHNKSIAIVDGKEISIQENIVNEIRILKWLSRHHPPPHMTRFVDYFQDEKNIFLVMEDGGMDFFKFVAECHKLINNKLLSITEWQCAIRVLFKQMVIFLDWLHNKMNICHMDISLENLLINNVFVMSDQHDQQIYFSHNFEINFCDFGLSEAFNGKDFRCNKFVGKTGYKAPKVYGKNSIFDARLADVWSLGIVFFMIAIGAPPFKRPSKKELAFNLIMNGQMDELLVSWKRMHHLSPEMFDLLQNMLQKEEKRITMKQIRQHPWLQ